MAIICLPYCCRVESHLQFMWQHLSVVGRAEGCLKMRETVMDLNLVIRRGIVLLCNTSY